MTGLRWFFPSVIAPLCAAAALLGASGCGSVSSGSGDPSTVQKRTPLQLARAAAKKRKIDKADEHYRAAYRQDKKYRILDEHVRFLIDVGRTEQAVELARTYNDARPGDTAGFELYADALIAIQDSPLALEVTDQLLQLDDSKAMNYLRRGQALILAGKGPEGIEVMRRGLQLGGKDPAVLMILGEALHKAGRIDEGQLHLRAATKFAPDSALAHALLGAVLRDQSEIDEASMVLRKAIALDPRSPRAYFELAILHNKLKQNDEAAAMLARVVELDPDSSKSWYAYGEILRITGKLDEAIAAYRRALELRPPHPKASNKLAMTLIEANRHSEAEVILTAGVRSDPDNPYNHYYLGAVYANARKYKLAIDFYERFLELSPRDDPERARVKKAIGELRNKL